MEEHIFYESEDILVSSTRLVLGDKTIVMQSICSINLDKEEVKTPWFSITLGGIGLALGLFSHLASEVGWILFVFGLILSLLGWARKRKEAIIIELSSGENEHITNEDVKDLQPVLKAINDVIVFRG